MYSHTGMVLKGLKRCESKIDNQTSHGKIKFEQDKVEENTIFKLNVPNQPPVHGVYRTSPSAIAYPHVFKLGNTKSKQATLGQLARVEDEPECERKDKYSSLDQELSNFTMNPEARVFTPSQSGEKLLLFDDGADLIGYVAHYTSPEVGLIGPRGTELEMNGKPALPIGKQSLAVNDHCSFDDGPERSDT